MRRPTIDTAVIGAVLMLIAPVALAVEATLDWAQRSVLGVPVSGVVSELHVAIGQQVKRGDALVSLDPRRFRLQVAEAEAAVGATAPALAEAKRELERARDLYDRTLLPEHELQVADLAWRQAQASHQAAQARLGLAKLELEHSVLRAPFDGVVVDRPATLGQVVTATLEATPLVVLGGDRERVARVLLPASRLAKLAVGQAVPVVLRGQRVQGRVQRIALEPGRNSSGEPAYALEVSFELPAGFPGRVGTALDLELP